jgi:hypothetical protein
MREKGRETKRDGERVKVKRSGEKREMERERELGRKERRRYEDERRPIGPCGRRKRCE